jgi:YD repeat-containing protein
VPYGNGTYLSELHSYTNGDLVTLVTPSGQTVTYTYTNHQIASIKVDSTTLLSSVTYDPFGPVTGWTWGNNTTVTRGYDEDSNPHQIVTAGVTNAYTVDYASRITGLSDSGLSSNSFTYGYDSLDRVTSGTSSAKSRGYTYDANGNRLTQTGSTAYTETNSTTNNQVVSLAGGGIPRTYAYDAAGNTKRYGNNSYTYNARGRMLTATVSGSTTTYIYNALGQLAENSTSTGATYLMYDEAGHLIGEYSSGGGLIQETIWMGICRWQPCGRAAARSRSTMCTPITSGPHAKSLAPRTMGSCGVGIRTPLVVIPPRPIRTRRGSAPSSTT